MTPVLCGCIVTAQYETAAYLYVGCAASDWLDGYIARGWNMTTVLGSFLDPMADKIMAVGVAGTLAYTGVLPVSLAALIFTRDAALVAGAFYLRSKTMPEDAPFFDTEATAKIEIMPSTLSKVNTVLLFSTLGLCLSEAAWGFPGNDVMTGLYYATAGTTIASGLSYANLGGFKNIRRK
jgi:cardiolipin synthase